MLTISGQDSINGSCSAGYYCSGGSTMVSPVGQSFGKSYKVRF